MRGHSHYFQSSLCFWMINSFLHQTAVSLPPCPSSIRMQKSTILHSTIQENQTIFHINKLYSTSIRNKLLWKSSKIISTPFTHSFFSPHSHLSPLLRLFFLTLFSTFWNFSFDKLYSYACRRKIYSFTLISYFSHTCTYVYFSLHDFVSLVRFFTAFSSLPGNEKNGEEWGRCGTQKKTLETAQQSEKKKTLALLSATDPY